MPLRPLNDQTPDFHRLLAQLERHEVLLARPDKQIHGKPNYGAVLRTQELFGLYVRTAETAKASISFYALPARELPRRRRRG